MSKTTLTLLLLAFVLIPVQAVFLNHLLLFGVALPIVFIYLIITLPMSMGDVAALTIAFITGMSVDILSDTLGVNALCCTLLCMMRKPVFKLYLSSDHDLGDQRPLPRTLGLAEFLKYAGTLVLVYCLMYFTVDTLGVFHFWLWLLRVAASSLFSFLIIYAVASLSNPLREKRL